MKIELHEIKVKEVVNGFTDNAENGVVGYGGKLNIRPAFQHRGLGRAALAFLHDYYPQARRFRLEVTPENRDAVRLYERLGYREMGYRQMVRE